MDQREHLLYSKQGSLNGFSAEKQQIHSKIKEMQIKNLHLVKLGYNLMVLGNVGVRFKVLKKQKLQTTINKKMQ